MEFGPGARGTPRSTTLLLYDKRVLGLGPQWVTACHHIRSDGRLISIRSGLTTFGGLMYASFGFTQLQVVLVDIPRNGEGNGSISGYSLSM
jgi:hypothetical protein